MKRHFLTLLVLGWAAVGLGEDAPPLKFPSPDGHFVVRFTEIKEGERGPLGEGKLDLKVELIEKASDKVMIDLGRADSGYLEDTVLVWSADSKRAAYGTRRCPNRIEEGETSVYFWNGIAFDEVPLPAKLPGAKVNYPGGIEGSVKPYGGAVKPVKWLKSGELQLEDDDMFLSRDNGHSYTGVLRFTVAFDKEHHASVKTVGKTETRVEK
jgi:hypothetical protein